MPRGSLYLADAESGGLSQLHAHGGVTPLLRDARLIWPMAPCIGPDDCLYVVDSQVNRIPLFTGGADRVARPWKLYRLPLAHEPSAEQIPAAKTNDWPPHPGAEKLTA